MSLNINTHKTLHWSITAVTALLASVGFSSAGQAITILNGVNDRNYLDLGATYPSVGQLRINGNVNCSGTLVNSMWVLTAAHCTNNFNSATFNLGGSIYSASTAITHPDWFNYGQDLTAGYDISLVQLKKAVTDVSPAQLYTGPDEAGEIATYVGFGRTGNGLLGARRSDSRKRGANNVIDDTGSSYYWSDNLLISDFDGPLGIFNLIGSNVPVDLEGSIAPGDSGGGMFINGLLAGVNSFIFSLDGLANALYGGGFASTRVSIYNSWISSIINPQGETLAPTGNALNLVNVNSSRQASSQQDDPHTVPEPATGIALLAVGGSLCLLRRRQRTTRT